MKSFKFLVCILFLHSYPSFAFGLFELLGGDEKFKFIEGHYSNHQIVGPGTFCDNEQKYKVDWKVDIEKADATFDDKGGIIVDLGLGASVASVEGYRKGGFLCSWMGGKGSINLNRMNGQFRIYSLDEAGTPGLDIIDVKMGRFALGRVTILLPGAVEVAGEPPEWLNRWLTSTIDHTLSFILKTELKKNIESILGKKLKDLIENGNFNELPPIE